MGHYIPFDSSMYQTPDDPNPLDQYIYYGPPDEQQVDVRPTTGQDLQGLCSQGLGQYHVYERDCSKYVQCSNGRPYLMSCPYGTLWDPDITTCNWPQNVRCPPPPEGSPPDGKDAGGHEDGSGEPNELTVRI